MLTRVTPTKFLACSYINPQNFSYLIMRCSCSFLFQNKIQNPNLKLRKSKLSPGIVRTQISQNYRDQSLRWMNRKIQMHMIQIQKKQQINSPKIIYDNKVACTSIYSKPYSPSSSINLFVTKPLPLQKPQQLQWRPTHFWRDHKLPTLQQISQLQLGYPLKPSSYA